MVRYGYDVVSVLVAQRAKPGVTQPPCGHLHRLARSLHLALSVEASVEQLHAVAPRLFRNQRLVLVALLPAQLEIAVRHAEAIARRRKERHHYH